MKFANTIPDARNRPKLGPCMSFSEALTEFGVTKPVLMQALGKDKNAPKPRARHRSNGSYYDAEQLRAWWADRSKKTI